MDADGTGAGDGRPRVIYVMGSGRSGSTVLDTLLGNHPRIESVGELARLSAVDYCACGAPPAGCPFWSAVLRRAGLDPERRAALARRFERLRSIPGLGRAARTGTAEYREYAAGETALFRAIADESGRPIVVDSSKPPARGLALALAPGLDVFVVHLVRDARGVARALARAHARDPRGGIDFDLPARSPARSALFWAAVNAAADRVRRQVGPERSLLLRYEDYVREPGAALARLGELVGVDLASLGAAAAGGEELAVGHTVAGNRLRMSGRVRLAPDERWRSELPARSQRLVYALTRPWMRRYGYPP